MNSGWYLLAVFIHSYTAIFGLNSYNIQSSKAKHIECNAAASILE